MKARQGTILAVAIGLLAFLAPILLSLRLAWVQGISDEKAAGTRFAADVVRRGEESSFQIARAMNLLAGDHLPPCSPAELDLMRQIDIGSSNLQMVGRISGNQLLCSSLGTTTPIDIGPPTLTTGTGTHERLDYSYGPVHFDRLDLLDYRGIAALVDPSLLVDIDTEGQGVDLALIVASTSHPTHVIISTGPLQQQWITPLAPGDRTSRVEGSLVISEVRSARFDLTAVSVLPLSLAYSHVKQFAAIFVPIGALCGIILAFAVAYISRLRLSPEGLLKAAARNQDFYVEYQPVVELASGHIVGAEALVRWKRGESVISPTSFISLAEEIGIIALITRSVLNTVTRDLPRLLSIDPDFHVAINLTCTDLKAAAIVDRLTDVLHVSGASPRNLIIEATEHGLISGPECFPVIERIHQLGLRVAIDDFGTGYSNLASLHQLDLDLLKIDKGFIDTIQPEGPTSQIISHIIDLARSFGIQIIAEGVENQAQVDFLRGRNVEYAQGWFFGHAMPVEDLCTFLKSKLPTR